jgi:5'-nucleotidase
MRRPLQIVSLVLLGLLLALPALAHKPLEILLTNDDGYNAPGIQALRGALLAAGHHVTVVAPLTNQSGVGGALDTNVGTFVNVKEESPGVWSVASTPGDSVRAGLGAVLAGHPPDLIVSGCNFGQNLGQPTSVSSGTVGAALQALYSGVPAVACSVSLDLSEAGATPIPFPSTFAAFAPASAFMVGLIDRLEDTSIAGLLPPRTALNVNFPVPYGQIQGVRVTRLALASDIDFVWQDVQNVIPSGGGGVLINIAINTAPDPFPDADVDAVRQKQISITPINGDMTSSVVLRSFLSFRLHGLVP